MERLLALVVFVAVGTNLVFGCCCFPRKVEGIIAMSVGMEQNGVGMAVTGLYNVSYDMDKAMVYMNGKVYVGGQEYSQKQIQDYKAMTYYIIQGGSCTSVPIPVPGVQCIPADALKVSSYYGIGDDTFDVDMYSFMNSGIPTTIIVMKDTCTVVAQHNQVPNMIIDTVFMGLKEGITDPSVFEIPSICKRLRRETSEAFVPPVLMI